MFFQRLNHLTLPSMLAGCVLAVGFCPPAAGQSVGPDVFVGELYGDFPSNEIASYGSEIGISAFAVGTMSCNVGDEQALWIQGTNAHPVIAQNMYRLNNDRFEQIGMSWVKHGICALQQSVCGTCRPAGGGCYWALGVGCSDPYSAFLNGSQPSLGPRYHINAYTGDFPYPASRPPLSESILDRRLQVHNADLDPALNKGALYFAEGQYVTADDAQAGNGTNNASYRQLFITGPHETSVMYTGQFVAEVPTQRMRPAIRAWRDVDPEVRETDVEIPNQGLLILAAKAIDRGGGVVAYEYAVQNLNSDRSCGSFTVPLPPGAVVLQTGFHDVDYHSGEPFDRTDWDVTITDDAVIWATTPFTVDPNANALRWGTLYNFRLEARAIPGDTTVTLGIFKPGHPPSVTAATIGPALDPVDCNDNGIPDVCDTGCESLGCAPPCATSADCDGNGVPDECQSDCNANGVADVCDIRDGTSGDCQPNGIPDDCERDCDGDGLPDDCDVPEDCDADGIADCLDLCPCSSDEGACVCPPIDVCCFATGFCIPEYPRNTCFEDGGTPGCGTPQCIAGCMLEEVDGDFDRDGDRDVRDLRSFFTCYSGPSNTAGYALPSLLCRARFDVDDNKAVDLIDYKAFHGNQTGPAPP